MNLLTNEAISAKETTEEIHLVGTEMDFMKRKETKRKTSHSSKAVNVKFHLEK